jgi:hypothetical protein
LNPVVHYWAALRSLNNGKAPAEPTVRRGEPISSLLTHVQVTVFRVDARRIGVCHAVREDTSMVKTITALLGLALAMPSTVMGQPRMVQADQFTKTWIFDTNPASNQRRGFVGREGVWPATASATTTAPDPQQPPQRSWAGRHPVALGAIIGTAGGALWGASIMLEAGVRR